MGSYKDISGAFEQMDPTKLADNEQDQYYRWYQLMLIYGCFDALNSLSYSYREVLKLQQAKATDRSRVDAIFSGSTPLPKKPEPAPVPRPPAPGPQRPPLKPNGGKK